MGPRGFRCAVLSAARVDDQMIAKSAHLTFTSEIHLVSALFTMMPSTPSSPFYRFGSSL
jgi:hypothetical protein